MDVTGMQVVLYCMLFAIISLIVGELAMANQMAISQVIDGRFEQVPNKCFVSPPYFFPFIFFAARFSPLTSFFSLGSTILYFPLTPLGLPAPLFAPPALITLTAFLFF
jgi:hypothetical protein